MPYRDIIVQTQAQTEADAAPARYEIAAELAARHGGRLTGLYLKDDLVADLARDAAQGGVTPADLGQRIIDRLRCEDERAVAAAGQLEKVAQAWGVACDCHVISGDTPRDMIAEARHADLVVVGSAVRAEGHGAFAVDVVMGAGAPVLVVPPEVENRRIGARVLVAWNGSLESSRALRDALPLLLPDAALEIRIAHPKHDRTDAAALRHHLEQHQCRANVEAVENQGQSIPDWLIAEAVRTECDLIVLGVYGHRRLRDFVLSDVSRRMLTGAPLPLLISA